MTAVTCARCHLAIGDEEDLVLQYKMTLHPKCSEFICFRCKLPISKGALYVEANNGRKSHWGCTVGVVDYAIDNGPGIGLPED